MSNLFTWQVHGDGKTLKPGEVVEPDERLTWSALGSLASCLAPGNRRKPAADAFLEAFGSVSLGRRSETKTSFLRICAKDVADKKRVSRDWTREEAPCFKNGRSRRPFPTGPAPGHDA